MASPVVVKPGGAGFGEERLIVRGSIFAPEPTPSELRFRYADYPERVTQNPVFPYPGRRGGSRPRAEELETGSLPYNPIFPQPRPREIHPGQSLGGALPSAGSPSASPVLACVGDGGIHMQIGGTVVAGATSAFVSLALPRAFVIRYISNWWSVNDPSNVVTSILVSANNDISTAGQSNGVRLDQSGFGGREFVGTGVVQESFPNFVWISTPAFIKVVQVNGNAANQSFQTIINLDWLD